MPILSKTNETAVRTINQIESLMKSACAGEVLWTSFLDPKTVEIIVNDDGSVWTERLGEPQIFRGFAVSSMVHSLILNVAGFHNQIVDAEHPICEAEFPVDGSRFEGIIPPVVGKPIFALRKKASSIFTLDQYVEQKIMTESQKKIIEEGIVNKKNMLIVGGTGSGKTTLINGIIQRSVELCPENRFIIIEDTGEIQCAAKNKTQLRADVHTSMTTCLKATLRLAPSRILVGEVRGPEALDLLDAWNTGHPGGFATVHANTAVDALDRVKSLVQRNEAHPREGLEKMIASVVNIVINIARENHGRRVRQIISVKGYDSDKGIYLYDEL